MSETNNVNLDTLKEKLKLVIDSELDKALDKSSDYYVDLAAVSQALAAVVALEIGVSRIG